MNKIMSHKYKLLDLIFNSKCRYDAYNVSMITKIYNTGHSFSSILIQLKRESAINKRNTQKDKHT